MITTYGEALVDMIEMPDGRFTASLGGAVCNFTLAVARQGLPAMYVNPLSKDNFGDGFAAMLQQAGVRLASPARSARPTSLAIVTLDAGGSPSYAFHREQVADRDITPDQATTALPAGMRLFHTGGLALVPDDLEATLAIARAAAGRGALVSVDANVRPLVCGDLAAYAAGVRRAVAQADLLKVSEEDLHHMGYAGMAPLDAARLLLGSLDVKLVALTLGAQGAVLLSRQATAAIAAPAGIAVADTVGCGDCFLAGLVASLSAQGVLDGAALGRLGATALEQAGRYAVATASLNAMRAGCNPPTAAEVEAFQRAQAA